MVSPENYKKYRGKCREMSEALAKENPNFRLVRGLYYEPLWNREEPHWWCVDEEGQIHDPTRKQYPSGGQKEFYREFDGYFDCEECGRKVNEDNVIQMGRYPVCSERCAKALVGI